MHITQNAHLLRHVVLYKMEIKLPTSKEHVRRMQTLHACYARDKLFKSLGYTADEIGVIKITFDNYFDVETEQGIILSQFYTFHRPNWIAEFLIIVKVNFLQIKQQDNTGLVHLPGCGEADYQKMFRAVYMEDSRNHFVALAHRMDTLKYIMKKKSDFEKALEENVRWLQQHHKDTYANWKNHVAIDWEKYELPGLYPPAAPSYFARAHKLMNW